MFTYIFLQCTFMDHLPMALALCLLPFLMGWLAAYAFHKVGGLNGQINELTTLNGGLTTKVNSLTAETTDLRVQLTQRDAEVERLTEALRKCKSDAMLVESDRNALREQLANATDGSASKVAKAAVAATILFAGVKYKTDDLKIVEGIGPKIADLLIKEGITTWKQLSKTSPETITGILQAAGPNFQIHDPGTWPRQAKLADEGKWDELKKLQDELSAGK